MLRSIDVFNWSLGAVIFTGLWSQYSRAQVSVEPARAEFAAADANNDHRLSVEEYASGPGEPEVRKRDFNLFDLDSNGQLTRAEFAAIPGSMASSRGAMPDPFDHLVDAAVEAVDEVFVRLGRGERTGVEIPRFVGNVVGGQNPELGEGRPEWASQADPDEDGQVTRAEARRFVEIHLGVRAPSGEQLRARNGRVAAYGRFLGVDDNGAGC